jgi:hypothetical protein
VPTVQLAPDQSCVSFDLEFTMYKLGYRYLNQELAVLLPLQIIMFVPCICQFTTEKGIRSSVFLHSSGPTLIFQITFVGWPMNIRRHGRHVGQPAYVHRLMCRPNKHKRVYLAPPFLSPTSLSLSSLPRAV